MQVPQIVSRARKSQIKMLDTSEAHVPSDFSVPTRSIEVAITFLRWSYKASIYWQTLLRSRLEYESYVTLVILSRTRTGLDRNYSIKNFWIVASSFAFSSKVCDLNMFFFKNRYLPSFQINNLGSLFHLESTIQNHFPLLLLYPSRSSFFDATDPNLLLSKYLMAIFINHISKP